MIEVNLLTYDQVRGEGQLKCLEKYGRSASSTDVGTSLGLSHLDWLFTRDGSSYADRATWYWLRDAYSNPGQVYASYINSEMDYHCFAHEMIGVRPIFSFSSFSELFTTKLELKSGCVVADRLEYVTKIITNSNDIYALNRAEKKGKLIPTGKVYTLPSGKNAILNERREYFYDGRKVVPFPVSLRGSSGLSGKEILSDGTPIYDQERVWGEVSGIEGFLEGNRFLSKKVLFPMMFDSTSNCYEMSTLKMFLENTFLQELVPSDIAWLLERDNMGREDQRPLLSSKMNFVVGQDFFHTDCLKKDRFSYQKKDRFLHSGFQRNMGFRNKKIMEDK